MKGLLTINEVVETLGGKVGYKTIYNAIHHSDERKKLKATRIGGQWLVSVEHLNEWLQSQSNSIKAIYSF